ncbi:MAG: hypothetical protein MJZ58_01645 [Paludibacteraceae bacterium]|nr:hypothetical protein [Paludibacteraceae bacterium]
MKTLSKAKIEARYKDVYTPLVKQFCDKVRKSIALENYMPISSINEKGEEVYSGNRAPAPFLPIIGNGYYTAPIRVAIYGMETLKWHDLYKFITKFQSRTGKRDALARIKAYTDGIEGVVNKKHKVSRFLNNYALPWYTKNNFWGFVFNALACIYGIKEKDIKERPDLLRSFIWGNVNAYEKYDATWKDMKVDADKIVDKKEDWKKVFKASKCFNSAQLLLPYARPQIMVIFHWEMQMEWLIVKDGITQPLENIVLDWTNFTIKNKLSKEQEKNLVNYIKCYYLSETNTFVLHTMHPSGMNPNCSYWKGNGLEHKVWKAAIRHALRQIMANSKFSSSH